MKSEIDPNKVPQLRGEFLYIPFVGAIIERDTKSGKQILIQIRHKETESKYQDVIEIPGGKFRAFEDVYREIRREAREESGIEITYIEGETERQTFENRDDTSDLIVPFCVTQMKEGPFIGLIFLCKGKGKLAEQTNETRNIQWMRIEELKDIVNKEPERIYTAFLAPLKKYLEINLGKS